MSQPAEHGQSMGQANLVPKVGYCNPPEAYRFRKGVSGNPKGRPRKEAPADTGGSQSSFADLILKEASRPVRLEKNGKFRTRTLLECVVRVIGNKALTGDVKAAGLIMSHVKNVEQSSRKEKQRSYERTVSYQQRWAEKLHRTEQMGYEPFDPLPHPEDIQIDSKRQRVIINGPLDDVEKAEWDRSEALRKEAEASMALLDKPGVPPARKLKYLSRSQKAIRQLVDDAAAKLASVNAYYPPKAQRRRRGFDLEQWRKENGKGREPPKLH